jgi:hypothetical protein
MTARGLDICQSVGEKLFNGDAVFREAGFQFFGRFLA